MAKGAFFFDIDGVIFKAKSHEPIQGVLQVLNDLKNKGCKIILTTYGGDENFPNSKKYSKKVILKALEDAKVPYNDIVFDVPSPRIIINDSGCAAINRLEDMPWT